MDDYEFIYWFEKVENIKYKNVFELAKEQEKKYKQLKSKTKKMSTTKRISKTTAVNLITNSKGKMFTVTFLNKNGKKRTINGNYNSNRKSELGYLKVNDMKEKKIKNVNTQTIKNIKINKTTYSVR